MNEGRGIYITYSDDEGQVWSDPVQVFDAEGAGWSMVDNPRLVLNGNQILHAVWMRYSLPSGVGPLGLYYASSNDGGITWSEPTLVADKPVLWSELASDEEQSIHRVWQEVSSSGQSTLWHEYSPDNGISWDSSVPASVFGQTVGTPSMALDENGNLHLLQIISRGVHSYVLQHWLWNGERWLTENSLDLNLDSVVQIGSMVIDVSSDGNLATVFSGLSENTETGIDIENLYFTDRLFESSQISTQSPAITTPTQQIQSMVTLIPMQTSTPTIVVATDTVTPVPTDRSTGIDFLSQEPTTTGNSWVIAVLGPVFFGILVLVIILLIYRFFRRSS